MQNAATLFFCEAPEMYETSPDYIIMEGGEEDWIIYFWVTCSFNLLCLRLCVCMLFCFSTEC